jgi:hypothetical protein
MQDIMYAITILASMIFGTHIHIFRACKVTAVACGGVTHWALSSEDNKPMTIAWGQNATNGELGLGSDQPKSTTKPVRQERLDGLDVFA